MSAPDVYALSSAKVERSNSRMTGCSAAPDVTGSWGNQSASTATARSSWMGLRNDHRNETASASTRSSSTSTRAAATTSSGSRGVRTAPWRSMRSCTPTMQRRSTTCGGITNQPSSLTRRPRERDQVFESLRRDEAHPTAGARREHVGHRRSAQAQAPHPRHERLEREAGAGGDEPARVEHAAPEIIGRGRRLGAPRAVAASDDDVGERAPNVDADAQHSAVASGCRHANSFLARDGSPVERHGDTVDERRLVGAQPHDRGGDRRRLAEALIGSASRMNSLS